MLSDSDIAGDDVRDNVAMAARPPPVARSKGREHVFLVLANHEGLWSAEYKSHTRAADYPVQGSVLLGIVVSAAWRLSACSTPASCAAHAELRDHAVRATDAATVRGFVEYPVFAAARLLRAVAIERQLHPDLQLQLAMDDSALETVVDGEMVHEPGRNVLSVRGFLEQHAGTPVNVASAAVAPGLAWQVLEGLCSVLHVVALSERLNRRRLLLPDQPSAIRIKRWLASIPADDAAHRFRRCPNQDALPRKVHWSMKQAHVILDWLEASSFIRDQKNRGKLQKRSRGFFATTPISAGKCCARCRR